MSKRSNEKDSVTVAEEPSANRYTADAAERIAKLRTISEEFPDESDPRPLKPAEIGLAKATSASALEKAALFTEATPNLKIANTADLRDSIAFELAYGGLRDEALALARRIEHAIMRRKLKAVRVARGVYRVAKGYVTLDAGDGVRTHKDALGQSLARTRRKKLAPPEGDPEKTSGSK